MSSFLIPTKELNSVKCSYTYVDSASKNLCDGVYCSADSNCESQFCSADAKCDHSPLQRELIILLTFSGLIVIVLVAWIYYRRKRENGGCFKKEKLKKNFPRPYQEHPNQDNRLLLTTQPSSGNFEL